MEMRIFGRTGLRLSRLGFGCGAVGGLMVRGMSALPHKRTLAALAYIDDRRLQTNAHVRAIFQPSGSSFGVSMELPLFFDCARKKSINGSSLDLRSFKRRSLSDYFLHLYRL
jgi:hypothetical protein